MKSNGKSSTSKFFIVLVICGAVLFGIIAYIVMKSTATVSAVVPNQAIASGTRITDDMLATIQIPANTPGEFISDKTSVVGQKMKVNVEENQLLYINDFMSSWDSFSEANIPDDYVITSIKIPSDRAVGGMITSGDSVDILGVPNSSYQNISKETMDNNLGAIAENSYGADGINVYWVLANVTILETDSTLSTSNDASISTVTQEDGSGSSDGNYYIVALSYNDYKKLRLCETYLDFWMSICPEINKEDGSNLELMGDSVIKSLEDAQKQSTIEKKEEKKVDENGNPVDNDNNDNSNANTDSSTSSSSTNNNSDDGSDDSGDSSNDE